MGINPKTFDDIVCVRGIRPDLKRCKNWPPELTELIGKCWGNDIHARPSFTEVVKKLSEIEENIFGGSVEDIELQVQGCACAIM